MGVELFIFDLDGVITHTSTLHGKAWEQLCDSLGLTFNDDLFEGVKGISRRESLELILSYHGVSNRYTEEEKIQLMDEKNKIYQQLLETISEKDYLPGIKELLIDIKQHNHPIAIASASENAPTILYKLNAEPYIDYIVNPKHVKNGKPAPDIFLAAAKHFDVVPEYCIAIEDAQSGIDGIREAGMFAVGVGKHLINAHITVERTNELTYDKLIKVYNTYRKQI